MNVDSELEQNFYDLGDKLFDAIKTVCAENNATAWETAVHLVAMAASALNLATDDPNDKAEAACRLAGMLYEQTGTKVN